MCRIEGVGQPVKRGPPAVPLSLPVVRCGNANTSRSVVDVMCTTVPTLLSTGVSVAMTSSTDSVGGHSMSPKSVEVSTLEVQTLRCQELSGSTACPDIKLCNSDLLGDRGICSS